MSGSARMDCIFWLQKHERHAYCSLVEPCFSIGLTGKKRKLANRAVPRPEGHASMQTSNCTAVYAEHNRQKLCLVCGVKVRVKFALLPEHGSASLLNCILSTYTLNPQPESRNC